MSLGYNNLVDFSENSNFTRSNESVIYDKLEGDTVPGRVGSMYFCKNVV